MGYDMNLEFPPEEMAEAKAAHDQAFSTAMTTYKEDPEAFSKIPEDPTYFRLNIFGMQRYRAWMTGFGMINDFWPPWNEIESVEGRASNGLPGIPGYKLGSNDGWLVLPEEITEALESYDKYDRSVVLATVDSDPPEYWDKWIQFLRTATTCGGFRVY